MKRGLTELIIVIIQIASLNMNKMGKGFVKVTVAIVSASGSAKLFPASNSSTCTRFFIFTTTQISDASVLRPNFVRCFDAIPLLTTAVAAPTREPKRRDFNSSPTRLDAKRQATVCYTLFG